jgi:DNA segregation ATPase FtsK/SpoIIIE-like protein
MQSGGRASVAASPIPPPPVDPPLPVDPPRPAEPVVPNEPPVPVAPPLPLPEPEKAPAERRKGAYTLPPLALLDAPRGERKIDERELMDGARLLEEKCREFSVEGSVVQITRSCRHDIRFSLAGVSTQGHRSCRRPKAGDAG